MQISDIKVSRRKTPPGACIEFIGREGESIEIELRGHDFETMTDADIIARAKSTMTDVGRIHNEKAANETADDQNLDMP